MPDRQAGVVRLAPAEPLERPRDELLARIDSDPTFLEQLAVDDHAAEREQILQELAGLDERRAELCRLWALGERSSEEWAAAREVLDEQQARLNVRLGELPAPADHAIDLTALPTAWPDMTLDERRQGLLFVRTRVTLHLAGTDGKALDKRVTGRPSAANCTHSDLRQLRTRSLVS